MPPKIVFFFYQEVGPDCSLYSNNDLLLQVFSLVALLAVTVPRAAPLLDLVANV